MKYSFIITAWNEAESVRKIFENVLNPEKRNLLPDLEMILVCPDEETKQSAEDVVKKYSFKNFVHIKDERKGKPIALNLALKAAKGDILILTDGDVLIAENSLPSLVEKFSDQKIGAVTGRPKSADPRDDMFGYWGNLLADAANDKRTKEFGKGNYYFVSGYLYAIRKLPDLEFPHNVLVDDGWITLEIINRGYQIAYSPDSVVWIKYPKNFHDWLKQKKRSKGGYEQLNHLMPKQNIKNQHTIFDEIRYATFPLKYASNLREFFYSIMLFPARIYLWLMIFWERKIQKKSFEKTWQRIESTK